MSIHIRPAESSDAELIVQLIRGLAEFEKASPEEVRVTADQIRHHGFGDRPLFECLIAEVDSEPVGFALFFQNFSTWEGAPGIYLEDIYVREEARGRGVGLRLMKEVAQTATARDCARLDFSVLHWNPAREFYHELGAVQLEEWLPYRLTGSSLARLATLSPKSSV